MKILYVAMLLGSLYSIEMRSTPDDSAALEEPIIIDEELKHDIQEAKKFLLED